MSTNLYSKPVLVIRFASALAAALWAAAANAASAEAERIAELEAEVAALQAEYTTRLAELQSEVDSKLTALDAEIANLKASRATAVAAAGSDAEPDNTDRLSMAGDLRLRYEHTSSHAGVPDRDRGVIRARLGASYRHGTRTSVGARLVTGDPDDPNSADVSMGSFVDDLTVSLDRAYIRYADDTFEASAGKIALPFRSTDLVWDGDVNPYGAGGRYLFRNDASLTPSLAAIYSIIDERVIEDDSYMVGGQVSLDYDLSEDWFLGANFGYYDYEIGSLIGANAGDVRGNNLDLSGFNYLSDFNLADFYVVSEYRGLGNGWPLQFQVDYVKNLGARVPDDTGYAAGFGIGGLDGPGSWHLKYAYSVAEKDAVFAAVSQDNTTYSTNYQQHAISFDWSAGKYAVLNLTGYLYRRKDAELALQPGDNDYVSRLRMNLQYVFD